MRTSRWLSGTFATPGWAAQEQAKEKHGNASSSPCALPKPEPAVSDVRSVCIGVMYMHEKEELPHDML